MLRLRVCFFWFILFFLPAHRLTAQGDNSRSQNFVYNHQQRFRDSLELVKAPLLPFPAKYHNRILPYRVDNTQNQYWPGIRDQYVFYSCQQHAGVAYVFAYEINRLRNQPGWMWQNSYTPHYTWNFMNKGERYQGVNFMQSFDVIKQQGHMNSSVYGDDTTQTWLGWISGYDKYYQGMFNRLKKVSAIEVNSTEGIKQLRNYLYDHLDGSLTGGIACFTTSSGSLVNMYKLPPGTEEEGKNVVLSWMAAPVHGMAVVGYNDSVRFDLNQDGKYTNDIDITGDGIVNARDWETGAFKIANSYGTWWSDEGYTYAMYASFASEYPYGGIWNNRVYVVEADSNYQPLLTARVSLTHNLRNQIRVFAGVSSDTSFQAPENVLEIPIFNFQGGPHTMQGFDTVPGSGTIEFGLDLTQLLNLVPGNALAKYYLAVEEQDPEHVGHGTVNSVSFIHYGSNVEEVHASPGSAEIADNGITFLAAVAAFTKPEVSVTNEVLPPVNPPQPYQEQLSASGGTSPYTWKLQEKYDIKETSLPMPAITGASIYNYTGYTFFHPVPLPFPFPFYGKMYDTIYVNHYGFICMEPQFLPEAYVTDEMNMLATFPVISPAFSQYYAYNLSMGDGIWVHPGNDRLEIRWRISVSPYYTSSTNDFALILYPNGDFAFRYGTIDNRYFTHRVFSGVSKGDDANHDLEIHWNANDLNEKTWLYHPQPVPAGIRLSEQGLLSLDNPGTIRGYDLNVCAADANRIEGFRKLTLAGDLLMKITIDGQPGDKMVPGKKTGLKLELTNRGLDNVQGLSLLLRSADSLTVVPDSMETVQNLAPGNTFIINNAFQVFPSSTLPCDYPVVLDLLANTSGKSWEKEQVFHIVAPVILIESPVVADGDNGRLDPGEVADLIVPLRNAGWLSTGELTLELVSTDPDISIISSSEVPVGVLKPSLTVESSFRLKAEKTISQGSVDTLIFTLRDTSGILLQKEMKIAIGKKPVMLVNLSSVSKSCNAMKEALDTLGVAYDTIRSLSFGYAGYEALFLLLGCSSQGSHTLTLDEATSLTGFLSNGGKLYMESYSSWYYLNKTPLHPWFRYTSNKVPAWLYPGARGVAQTFCDAMQFDFSGSIRYAIFDLQPVSPAFTSITNTDSLPMNLQIAYDGTDYKTIGTLLEFASLNGANGISTRKNLMLRYLDFFGVNTTGLHALFHADKTKICAGKEIAFTDDSFDNVTAWNWEFPGGQPEFSSSQNPVVTYSQPGVYDVKLTVSDGVHSKFIVRRKFVSVEQCTGYPDRIAESSVTIFPNPAKDWIYIEIPGNNLPISRIHILDFFGRVVRSIDPADYGRGSTFRIPLSGLPKGLWFIQVSGGKLQVIKKLVID